ncbi:MAG TPA: hypothetical protein VLZ03_04570 [Thermodesulfobacteriota bacterium]|nr:hypothetical protein [Thermodesulfobacteriota bacterium]
MTNTLHRQGSAESLRNDYVIFAHTAKGITREGSAPKLREFMRICLKYRPANMGDSKQGNIHQDDIEIEKLIADQEDGAGAAAVFTDLDTLQKVLDELVAADLGISINVSGLFEEVHTCCRRAGIERHSVEHSLGFWGLKERLPEREILEFNSMCGHGMVSFNLIRKMIEHVKLRRLTPRKAAKIMARCCECGVFNPVRAEILLEKARKGGK